MSKSNNSNFVMSKFLLKMVEIQHKTSPIKMSIGFTSDTGIVKHGYIKITSAPGTVLDEVISFCNKHCVFYSIQSGGMLLDFSAAVELKQ